MKSLSELAIESANDSRDKHDSTYMEWVNYQSGFRAGAKAVMDEAQALIEHAKREHGIGHVIDSLDCEQCLRFARWNAFKDGKE